MMMDALWARLLEAQALTAGLEAENRVLRLQCRRYLGEWTEARDRLAALKLQQATEEGAAG